MPTEPEKKKETFHPPDLGFGRLQKNLSTKLCQLTVTLNFVYDTSYLVNKLFAFVIHSIDILDLKLPFFLASAFTCRQLRVILAK